MWSQITNVTDGRTDGQTDGRYAIPRPRICTKVHCAVKTGPLCVYIGDLEVFCNKTVGVCFYSSFENRTLTKTRDYCVEFGESENNDHMTLPILDKLERSQMFKDFIAHVERGGFWIDAETAIVTEKSPWRWTDNTVVTATSSYALHHLRRSRNK